MSDIDSGCSSLSPSPFTDLIGDSSSSSPYENATSLEHYGDDNECDSAYGELSTEDNTGEGQVSNENGGAATMPFENFPPPNVHTLNKILHTPLDRKIAINDSHLSYTMCTYIDENKHILTDNRSAFVEHSLPVEPFIIKNSGLIFKTWALDAKNKLKEMDNFHVPYITIAMINRKRSAAKKNKNSNDTPTTAEDDEPPSKKIKTAVKIEKDLLSPTEIKREYVRQCSELFQAVRDDNTLVQEDRLSALNVIKRMLEIKFLPPEPFDKDSFYRNLLSSMSEEQRNCMETILEYAYPADFDGRVWTIEQGQRELADVADLLLQRQREIQHRRETNKTNFKLFLIDGYAGCGKTAIIQGIGYYVNFNHTMNTRIVYVTQTNVLCQSMRCRCPDNPNIQYLTFFKFLAMLNLNYIDKKEMLMHCDSLKIDSFQNTCGTNFLREIGTVIALPPLYGESEDDRPRLFIVFDEVYTLSEGKLSLFLFMVRKIKQNYPNVSIYCILVGDKSQLRPFTKIEEVKVDVNIAPPKFAFKVKQEVLDPGHVEDLVFGDFVNNPEMSIDVEPEENIQMLTSISQCESVQNAVHFTLTQQFRILDSEYNEFVNVVRNTENRIDAGRKLMEDISKKWPEKCKRELIVVYPFDEIAKIHESLDMHNDLEAITMKLKEQKLFERTLDTTIFCFTNVHAHYYNIALSFSYWNQLKDRGLDKQTIQKYITFCAIYNNKFIRMLKTYSPNRLDLINSSNSLFNILPLIRYCPYKLLVERKPVVRLSIVYLMDWDIDEHGSVTDVMVYSPEYNAIVPVMPVCFEMNLFRNTTLFGLPLQLACSSTFASSQGLTLHNKIAVSCTNISKAELYVCLTRIRKADDLVAIH